MRDPVHSFGTGSHTDALTTSDLGLCIMVDGDIAVLMANSSFREILRNNHVFLKQHLSSDVMVDYLYQKGVFSEEECEKYRCRETRTEKCQFLLTELNRKEPKDYKTFCAILAEVQPFIKEILDDTAKKMGVNGLVFVSRSEVEAEFIQERQDNLRRIQELEMALTQERKEKYSSRFELTKANKETKDYRHRYEALKEGIGDRICWLMDSQEVETLLLCPALSINRLSEEIGLKQRISRFPYARVPLNLQFPPSPIYLETNAEVELETKMVFGSRLLVLGLYKESPEAREAVVPEDSPDWGICVELCPKHHFEVCTQLWQEKKRFKCYKRTMPNSQGTQSTLCFGIVMDVSRGRLGFTDINRNIVLGKFDIDIDSQYQMFALGAKPDAGARIDITVTSADEIILDIHKQKLILEILQ